MPVRPTFTVLLVEDYADDREMYADHLRMCGFRVVATGDAADALALAHTADVIVTDLRLRGSLDGFELIRRVRADPRTSALPVLVVTACSTEPERQEASASGCSRFLVKPCLPETLAAHVMHMLERGSDLTTTT
jgi:CheY-like chemotaxis protein